MSCQSSLNRQELKVCLPSLADTDALNCHRSSRLCIVHMMSTVLSVYTRPVKTDSKTGAGVHNDVSSPSIAQQSDRPGSWKESEVQRQPPNGKKSGRHNTKHKYLQIRKTKRTDYIIHTNDPLKDRTHGPKRAKGTTTIQLIRKITQIKRSKPWRRYPNRRLKHLGERPVTQKQRRGRNTPNVMSSRRSPSTEDAESMMTLYKKNDSVLR